VADQRGREGGGAVCGFPHPLRGAPAPSPGSTSCLMLHRHPPLMHLPLHSSLITPSEHALPLSNSTAHKSLSAHGRCRTGRPDHPRLPAPTGNTFHCSHVLDLHFYAATCKTSYGSASPSEHKDIPPTWTLDVCQPPRLRLRCVKRAETSLSGLKTNGHGWTRRRIA